MSFDLYQEAILDELRHPQNKGELVNADVTLHETNASCGDDVTIYISFDEAQEKVSQILWQGQGCAISQATMSLLSEKLLGMNRIDIQKLEKKDLEDLLGLEQPIAYGRTKCLLLGLETVKKMV